MKTNQAIRYFGSAKKLADALGITRSAISQWGQNVPKLRAYEIEVITKGCLSKNDNFEKAN